MFQPLHDCVLVKPDKGREEMTEGGIVKPDVAREEPDRGTVLRVGPGRLTDTNERLHMSVNPGDVVLYARFAGVVVEIEDETLKLLRDEDILAVDRS